MFEIKVEKWERFRRQRNRLIVVLLISASMTGCGSDRLPNAPDDLVTPVRVLMITTTAGFRHDSIPAAIASIRSLSDVTLTATEDLSALADSRLVNYDVVMFALTSGELALSAAQKSALVEFVGSGRGFIGIHSASDTLYDWPEYGHLVGAYFKEHPWTQHADVVVEDQSHLSVSGLGARFSILEEFYTFRDNPRGRVQVLLRLDAPSVGSTGDYPLAWSHAFGAGRSYYNALGHFSQTWNDERFRRQLAGAIRWASGRATRHSSRPLAITHSSTTSPHGGL
jgi:type 1 glutamine amidotransferase